MRYMLVDTDNFGGDYPDEKFQTDKALVVKQSLYGWTGSAEQAQTYDTEEGASKEADRLNGNMRVFDSRRYVKVVQEGYELQPGFEP